MAESTTGRVTICPLAGRPAPKELVDLARPPGTENIYKSYAESFVDQAHLNTIVAEARAILDCAMGLSA